MTNINPQLMQALNYLRQGQHGLGIQVLEPVLQQNPGHAEANHLLGSLLIAANQKDRGVYFLERAMQLQPDNPMFQKSMGDVRTLQGDYTKACDHYDRVAKSEPKIAKAHKLLADTCLKALQIQRGANAYTNGIQQVPDDPDLRVEQARFLLVTGSADDSVATLKEGLEIVGENRRIRGQLSTSMNYSTRATPQEVCQAHKNFGQMLYQESKNPPLEITNDPDPDRRLKIAYISPDMREHSVAYFFEPLVEHHNRDQVEVFCYANFFGGRKKDHVSARLMEAADQWRDITDLSADRVASQLQADQIDIAVDLAGLTYGHSLRALCPRPCPIQINYLGYPNTTGIPVIDYRIVDHHTDPAPDADALVVEKLARMDDCFLCYRPPDGIPDPAPSPCTSNSFITFGSFNMLSKLSPETAQAWATILTNIPNSKLLLKNHFFRFEELQDRFRNLFESLGVAGDRILFKANVPTTFEHMELYSQVDIALDPFPYNGTTTTCEALWMGVPVVTLTGKMHAGRVGTSLLNTTGLNDNITPDIQSYIDRACTLANNQELLSEQRMSLRNQLISSPLCDEPGFCQKLESLYRTMWQDWCNQQETALGKAKQS